ncbi:MAG TPA: ABC transporter permease subunit [Kouleothrix sp.]|uniref:ABC transporter permease n=1 Tax=Kouleothrix sp. TaxID=2779161 RepID=UPI002C7A6D9C|nr:ABC transporter permease subunit [Kouleothrix sp.]HRC75593.1 ABC transporter permease subunit [Kouleothrix sp.]
MRKRHFWPWVWVVLGLLYFFVPLIATFDFSLRARKGVLSFDAYANVFDDTFFYQSFTFSLQAALLTIVISALLIVPTVYWVQLRVPRLRPVVEFVTLLPFVVPAVVLVFGLIRTYSSTLLNSRAGGYSLLVASYVVLSFPYMYRAIDTGLRAIDVRTLTEAAQSLGASWATILLRVIFPNVRIALLSGAFLSFAIVMGEYTIASLLAQPAFGPYMNLKASSAVYEPSALAILSFGLTWGTVALIQFLGRGAPGQTQLGGVR